MRIMNPAAEEQALTRAFDRLSLARAYLSKARERMDLLDSAELWWAVSQARMAVTVAREALEERTRCRCGHTREAHWSTSPPYPMMGCRDCDDCSVYEAREG